MDELFTEVVQRYTNVGANQFVKDFRRQWQVKKAMAHRQMVMARKDKQVQKDAKVPLEKVIQDNSCHKEVSHNQLKDVIGRFGYAVLGNMYTKTELVTLSKGYGLQPNSRANKAQLGKSLADAIKANRNVPFPWSLVPGSQLQAAPLPHGRLGVRININRT